MLFRDLLLSEPILRSVSSEGYTTATPIQAQAIPHILAGKDVLGCAQTGTGKTAAFALPMLHRLSQGHHSQSRRHIRALVLCPTRELATQTADGFRAYGKNLHIRHTVVFGGVGQNPQVHAMRAGVDIVIATPGRLMDLMEQGHVDLSKLEVLVLDEADRMLDMGFIHDIRRIVAEIPSARQTLLFSATMPNEIRSLAQSLLRDPVNVQVAPVATVADSIEESVYFVNRGDKPSLLAHLYEELPMARTIVFTRTKRGADRVVKRLHAKGIRAEAIHGDKTQNARERALNNFKASKTPILVATDIASRGIDVDGITHVVNYDLTHEPDSYVHRIGRTARAGASGVAVSFCDVEEVPNLRAIEKLIRRPIPVMQSHAYRCEQAAAAANRSGQRSSGQRGAQSSQQRPAHPSRAQHSQHHPKPAGKPAHASHPVGAGVRQHRSAAPARTATAAQHPTAKPRHADRRHSHPLSRPGQPARFG